MAKKRTEAQKELVKKQLNKRGFANDNEYRKELAKRKGYKNRTEYVKVKQEELARKRGYKIMQNMLDLNDIKKVKIYQCI